MQILSVGPRFCLGLVWVGYPGGSSHPRKWAVIAALKRCATQNRAPAFAAIP